MAWPSKNPDDYLGRPLLVPRPPVKRRPLAELDPADWRIGTVRQRDALVWYPLGFATTYAASLVAGTDVVGTGRWLVLLLGTSWLAQFLTHRFQAARMVAQPWPPTLAFAPATGVPWLITLATALLAVFGGAALAGALTTSERWQTLGLLLSLALASLPSWLLERREARG